MNIFHTSPTAIRMLRKAGPHEPGKYKYHFKHMTTVGEPIEPEVWRWYYDVVGKREAVIVDTWWQTETGGFLCSTRHDWPYFAGDGALLAKDGYFRILGRVDDVINVAGHRLGTKELESACLTIDEVAEAAVVPVVDEIKGRVPEIYISLKPGVTASHKEVSDKVIKTIETMIGKIARPKSVHIVPDMPKTRSGKLMRRILAAISNTLDVGDITTLANPDVVEQIRVQVQGEHKVAAKEGPEDVKQFGSDV